MCVQAEELLRWFSDRTTGRGSRELFETRCQEFVCLAYDLEIWVDPKWHLYACPHNFPAHLSLFGGVTDCMEMVCQMWLMPA